LKHCLVNPGTTEFALLDESGNFFKLDETGNSEVISKTTTTTKKITVTVIGAVDHEILNVKSLSTGSSAPATLPELISQESGVEKTAFTASRK
jgi:hypothetical protein